VTEHDSHDGKGNQPHQIKANHDEPLGQSSRTPISDPAANSTIMLKERHHVATEDLGAEVRPRGQGRDAQLPRPADGALGRITLRSRSPRPSIPTRSCPSSIEGKRDAVLDHAPCADRRRLRTAPGKDRRTYKNRRLRPGAAALRSEDRVISITAPPRRGRASIPERPLPVPRRAPRCRETLRKGRQEIAQRGVRVGAIQRDASPLRSTVVTPRKRLERRQINIGQRGTNNATPTVALISVGAPVGDDAPVDKMCDGEGSIGVRRIRRVCCIMIVCASSGEARHWRPS